MSNNNQLTPLFEELKKVLEGKIDDDTLMKEVKKYVEDYGIDVDRAKRAIIKKYDTDATSSFVTADSIVKKIDALKGSEMNIDVIVKAIYVDKKEVNIRGTKKIIISGILGDETGTCPFTIWEGESVDLIKGETYHFKNAYTKMWNERVQINLGTRGKIEKADSTVDVPERTIPTSESREIKIGDIKEGVGNITVTGRIISTETRNINVKGESKVVYAGIIADDSGKIQYSAWNDYSLKDGETICVKNAYVRAWRGIPQLNMGDRCEVSRVTDNFGQIQEVTSKKTISDIVKIGGALDVAVFGTVVDLRTGSGLIKRCPQCNRSILNDECSAHGKIEPVFDLRMKLIVDDGTGALSAVVNRSDTEKLTGITLAAAEELAKAQSDMDSVSREIAQMIIMKRITIKGNVMSDDYGPMMIVKEASIDDVDVVTEAKKLYEEMEGAL
ncbi:MAG: single-stranded DNA-binding protein [Candidatus Methanogranum gryphiswaldense]|nr:MAG: single-stranded DNA-binding protein [Candidatus Methanogranum sp. U3.2.1]